MSNELVRILRAGTRGEASNRETVVRICYKPEDREKEVDEAFLNQPEEAMWPRSWPSWGTSTTAGSDVSGGVTWQDTNNLGG